MERKEQARKCVFFTHLIQKLLKYSFRTFFSEQSTSMSCPSPTEPTTKMHLSTKIRVTTAIMKLWANIKTKKIITTTAATTLKGFLPGKVLGRPWNVHQVRKEKTYRYDLCQCCLPGRILNGRCMQPSALPKLQAISI